MVYPNLFQLGKGYLKMVSFMANCVKKKIYYCFEKTCLMQVAVFYSFFSSINMNFNVNIFQTLIYNVIYRLKSNEKPATQQE